MTLGLSCHIGCGVAVQLRRHPPRVALLRKPANESNLLCKAHKRLELASNALFPEETTSLGKVFKQSLQGPWKYLLSYLVPTASFVSINGCLLTDLVFGYHQVPLGESRLTLASANLHDACATLCALAGAAFVFVLMPVMDALLGTEGQSDGDISARSSDSAHHAVLHGFVPLHFTLLATACTYVGQHDVHVLTFAALVMSLAVNGGLAFTVCHELLHSSSKRDHALCDAVLATMAYMHWRHSHIAHHMQVAQQHDPASARLGESLYAFVPRSIIGNLSDGVRMEMQRSKAQHVWQPPCRAWVWAAAPAAMTVAATATCGWVGGLLFVSQAVASVVLLEAVNYIEHYGLQRVADDNGRVPPVAEQHSWNADWMFTNAVIFNLQRHAHHHMHGATPYHKLKSLPAAPQLPASYSAMLLLALFPPLYFRIVEPRIPHRSAPHNTNG